MHSLGALGVWRRKFQTRENLRQASRESSAAGLKKRGVEPLIPTSEDCRKFLPLRYLGISNRRGLHIRSVPNLPARRSRQLQIISALAALWKESASVRFAAEPAVRPGIAVAGPFGQPATRQAAVAPLPV